MKTPDPNVPRGSGLLAVSAQSRGDCYSPAKDCLVMPSGTSAEYRDYENGVADIIAFLGTGARTTGGSQAWRDLRSWQQATTRRSYLDLYREFKDVLAEDRQVIVIGYSFRDAHVNEAVRRWCWSMARRVPFSESAL